MQNVTRDIFSERFWGSTFSSNGRVDYAAIDEWGERLKKIQLPFWWKVWVQIWNSSAMNVCILYAIGRR